MNKFKINKYSLSLFFLLSLVGTIFLSPVFAGAEVSKIKLSGITENNDFIVGPGKTEIFLNPGETVVKNISITNRVSKEIEFSITTEDFVGSNNVGQAVKLLGNEKSPYSLKDFLKPEIQSFKLNFGERITIPVRITIPKDAEPKGYYGAVLVSNRPEKKVDEETGDVAEGATQIVSRVGSLFLVRVNGESFESGHLTNFDLLEPKKFIYQEKPKGFEVVFENEGNVHLVPYGEISVTNIWGKEIGRLPIDAYFVLPESTRAREVIWTSDFFGIGRYKASISLYKGYGGEDSLEKQSVYFWVIPWKIIVIVFVVVAIIITLIHYLLSRFEIKRKQ